MEGLLLYRLSHFTQLFQKSNEKIYYTRNIIEHISKAKDTVNAEAEPVVVVVIEAGVVVEKPAAADAPPPIAPFGAIVPLDKPEGVPTEFHTSPKLELVAPEPTAEIELTPEVIPDALTPPTNPTETAEVAPVGTAVVAETAALEFVAVSLAIGIVVSVPAADLAVVGVFVVSAFFVVL